MSKRTFISLEKGFVGLVDETGHPLISPEKYVLPDIPGGMMARIEPSFSEGVMPVSLQSGGAGYIDEDGNVALPFVYEATTPFSAVGQS